MKRLAFNIERASFGRVPLKGIQSGGGNCLLPTVLSFMNYRLLEFQKQHPIMFIYSVWMRLEFGCLGTFIYLQHFSRINALFIFSALIVHGFRKKFPLLTPNSMLFIKWTVVIDIKRIAIRMIFQWLLLLSKRPPPYLQIVRLLFRLNKGSLSAPKDISTLSRLDCNGCYMNYTVSYE